MATDSGKNVVVADQLEALAIAAKHYTQNEIANSSGSAATFTLDTVPSTVEGAMWLEDGGSSPVIKLFYNGHVFKIISNTVLLDPQLTLETETLTVYNNSREEVWVSFLGEGEITVSDDYGGSCHYAPGRQLLIIEGTPSDTRDCGQKVIKYISGEVECHMN